MIWKGKKKPTKYYEVWREFEVQARACKIGLFACVGISVLLVFLSLSLAQRPVYVVRVDPDGRSFLVTDVEDGQLPTHQEAKAVAKKFLSSYMGFNSAHPEEPLRIALSMMTTRLFEQHRDIYKGRDLTAHIRALRVKTEFNIEENRVTGATENSFEVRISGRVHSKRLEEGKASGAEIERRFQVSLRLLRVQRTRRLPSGLLVDAFEYHLLTGKESGGISKS